MTTGRPRPVDVIVPQVGEAVAEVTLVRWLKRPGDRVARGEVLFEVDTEKAVVEIEAYEDGVLEEILAPDGAAVQPLQRVGVLRPDVGAAPDLAVPEPRPRATPAPPAARERVAAPAPRDRIPAAPRARLLANELGIDLATVSGTGEGGMITTDDVQGAAARPRRGTPLSKVRAAVAVRMRASKQRVPHFYVMADIDMSVALRLRDELRAEGRPVPSVTTIIVRACALTLASAPEFNASFVDGSLVARTSVGIGIAVATDEGLLVPVIADAQGLDLEATAQAVDDVSHRARDGRLRASDLGPRSTVVSNLGMHGVGAFIAIIDEPDPFIVAVGQVRDAVVALAGAPAVRPVTTLALSVDHRAFDGVQAARLLEEIRRHLERADELVR